MHKSASAGSTRQTPLHTRSKSRPLSRRRHRKVGPPRASAERKWQRPTPRERTPRERTPEAASLKARAPEDGLQGSDRPHCAQHCAGLLRGPPARRTLRSQRDHAAATETCQRVRQLKMGHDAGSPWETRFRLPLFSNSTPEPGARGRNSADGSVADAASTESAGDPPPVP